MVGCRAILPIIQMEHAFNKQASHYKFVDYFKHPVKGTACHRSAPKAGGKGKSDKLYTQGSSSRLTNKVSTSTHHSPSRPKHQKLLKTSVLNYLHKCRSEYEDASTTATRPKSAKHITSVNLADPDHKKLNEGEILQKTAQLLGLYRQRCGELSREKEGYRWEAEQAQLRIKQLERTIKLYKKERKSMQREK